MKKTNKKKSVNSQFFLMQLCCTACSVWASQYILIHVVYKSALERQMNTYSVDLNNRKSIKNIVIVLDTHLKYGRNS